jgi:hypothetical protein
MYSNLDMIYTKYIFVLLNVIEFIGYNSAYYASPPYIHFRNFRNYRNYRDCRDYRNCRNNYHKHNRKALIVKYKCELINNVTEYLFELCAIIDIMLPKKR